jgi:hypothetical protein
MKVLKGLFLIVLFSSCTYAQLDTSDYFPMHIGDRWEYEWLGGGTSITTIIGDTILTNGNRYFIFNSSDDNKWIRIIDRRFVVIFHEYPNIELKWLDLNANIGEIWRYDPLDSLTSFGYGLKDTGSYFNGLVNKQLKFKLFDCVSLFDTSWCSETPDGEPITITQGLGSTGTFFSTLRGAVINGVPYGLVSVQEDKSNNPSSFVLLQNYPNPFNPKTRIKYKLGIKQFISIKVFDMLGRNILTLFKGESDAGDHSLEFRGDNLPSGNYLIEMSNGINSKIIKTTLLK